MTNNIWANVIITSSVCVCVPEQNLHPHQTLHLNRESDDELGNWQVQYVQTKRGSLVYRSRVYSTNILYMFLTRLAMIKLEDTA